MSATVDSYFEGMSVAELKAYKRLQELEAGFRQLAKKRPARIAEYRRRYDVQVREIQESIPERDSFETDVLWFQTMQPEGLSIVQEIIFNLLFEKEKKNGTGAHRKIHANSR